MSSLSIIVPVLNEATVLAAALGELQYLRQRGAEVIVVDGGSEDGTRAIAAQLADRLLSSSRGRANQMNAGAKAARGDALLFLHADSRLPVDADELIAKALSGSCWGRFDVRLSGARRVFRVVEAFMNLRSRLTGIATGDQGIFVKSETFAALGGYPAIELMEDLALSKLLKRVDRPACLWSKIVASSRRWENQGAYRTIVEMWLLRFAYVVGAHPRRLARIYERRRSA